MHKNDTTHKQVERQALEYRQERGRWVDLQRKRMPSLSDRESEEPKEQHGG